MADPLANPDKFERMNVSPRLALMLILTITLCDYVAQTALTFDITRASLVPEVFPNNCGWPLCAKLSPFRMVKYHTR